MDTLSLERRLLGKFENTKQDSEWFSEVFNLKSILDTALNRDFLFSNWMNSYQNALHFENEHSKELGVILDLIVHVADILDDFQDGAKEMDGGEQLNEAVFILVFLYPYHSSTSFTVQGERTTSTNSNAKHDVSICRTTA